MNSKPLLLHFSTFTNQLHQMAKSASIDVHIARQFTRLNTFFCCLGNPTTDVAADIAADREDVNAFYCPQNNAGEDLQTFLSIGPTRWADFDRTGPAEITYYLSQAIGSWNAVTHTLNLDYDSYRLNKFVMGYSHEKAAGSHSSGEQVQSGSLVTFHFKGLTAATDQVEKVWTFAHSAVCLEIRETGAALYD